MFTTITVAVRKGTEGYVAGIKQEGDGYPYAGASPDEALGYAIREHWLGGAFKGPIKLELDIASNTPADAHMIPWLPKPGDMAPEGCEWDWTCPTMEETRWRPFVGAVCKGHVAMDATGGTFKFQIPLPPEYDVVITDDVTRQDAQGIYDGLITTVQAGSWNSVYGAYVTAIANRINTYDSQRTQSTGEPA